jgi:hypothetical protein
MTGEIWNGIVEPFSGDPAAAFILAQVLFELKEEIRKGRKQSAIKTLEEGIAKLYPYTDAHKAAYELYLLSVAGKLRPKHDPTVIVDELT